MRDTFLLQSGVADHEQLSKWGKIRAYYKVHVQFHRIDIRSSSLIQVPFLNLMANLQQRTGRINIRVGGNTQETATLVDSTPDGKILEKDLQAVQGTVSWESAYQLQSPSDTLISIRRTLRR